MECLLIGTGGMMPLPERHLNSLLVRVEGEVYLLDAGEGTQIAMKRWRAGFRTIRLLAVTHLHGDHVLGVPGVLMCRTHAEAEEPLTILGPTGIRRFVENTIRDLRYRLIFPIDFIEIDADSLSGEKSPVEFYRDDRCVVSGLSLNHGTPCLGYRVEELPRPGRFHPEKVREMGVPEGPLWGRLQRGETVQLEDGRDVTPEEVLGPPRRGRRCALVTDTVPCKNAYRLVTGADIAFIEGMFREDDLEKAADKAHMTVRKAARIGRAQGALRTVIVHLSPRYRNEDLADLHDEARAENETAEIGRDGARYEIPLPD